MKTILIIFTCFISLALLIDHVNKNIPVKDKYLSGSTQGHYWQIKEIN